MNRMISKRVKLFSWTTYIHVHVYIRKTIQIKGQFRINMWSFKTTGCTLNYNWHCKNDIFTHIFLVPTHLCIRVTCFVICLFNASNTFTYAIYKLYKTMLLYVVHITWAEAGIMELTRVARVFLVQYTKWP
jgi:hypothetical protein